VAAFHAHAHSLRFVLFLFLCRSPFFVRQRNQQPWRIRMDLPYDTMGDAEMLAMNIAPLQDEGVCCVWVISQSPDADSISHTGACGERSSALLDVIASLIGSDTACLFLFSLADAQLAHWISVVAVWSAGAIDQQASFSG
jgi:hypothetical protein